jgi:hypothetical protein
VQFDFLTSTLCHVRAQRLVQACFEGASGLDARWMDAEPRVGAYVVLYGLGGSDRVRFAERPQLVAFDAGYWNRKGPHRSYRVSVGGFHCPQLVMEGPSPGPARWAASSLPVGQGYNPNGPILLVGNGPKSNAVGAAGWTAAKAEELRKLFPGRRVLYRAKPNKPLEQDVSHDGLALGRIDDVLQGASLVVCRHSNVSVDACRWGVPVVCDDGAAAAIYPRRLKDWEMQPHRELRDEFLQRLAWWQWSAAECRSGVFWDWMTEKLRAIH